MGRENTKNIHKNSNKSMNKNAGMTLVETLTACIIMTILMTVLIQGILTASNWFAKSSEIKDDGEKTANRVEGAYDAEVTKDSKQLPVSLEAQAEGNPAVDLSQTENKQNEYKYKDTKFYTIDSDVTDYVPDASDPIYEPTRVAVANITSIVTSIVNIINSEGYASAGFTSEWQTYSNDAWVSMIKAQLGGNWPVISDEFKNKYNLSGGGMGSTLIIRAYVFGPSPSDVLFYITDDSVANQWVAFLIYDPASKVWLRVPKDCEGANFNNFRKNFIVAGTSWCSCCSYSYYEDDQYKYLHANNADNINSINPDNVLGILGFVRDESNGWDVMYPDD